MENILLNINQLHSKKYFVNQLERFFEISEEEKADEPRLEPKEIEPIPDTIKLLSYRLDGSVLKKENKNCKSNDKQVCIDNIVKFINNNDPLDFIFLQTDLLTPNILGINEFAELKILGKKYIYSSYMTNMIIFYDQKYELDDTLNLLVAYDKTGTLFNILFFKQKLCIVYIYGTNKMYENKTELENLFNVWINNKDANARLPNNFYFQTDSKKFNKNIFDAKKDVLSQEEREEIMEKLKTYNIIFVSSFNFEIKEPGKNFLYKRQFYGDTEKTCCYDDLQPLLAAGPFKKTYNIISSTYKKTKTEVFKIEQASTHLPIITTIKTN